MVRFAPVIGLLLASPVVYQALLGQRPVADALLYWLGGIAVAWLGCWLWDLATAPAGQVAAGRAAATPRRRRNDRD